MQFIKMQNAIYGSMVTIQYHAKCVTTLLTENRRDVPVGVPLDLSVMEWHELLKYNGIQVSQLIKTEKSQTINFAFIFFVANLTLSF